MKRIWVATLLGLMLGLGLAIIPQQPTPRPQAFMESNPAVMGPNMITAKPTYWQDFQWIILATIVGLGVGLPVLLVAKRRSFR